jgi:hypothetical protein
LLAGGLALASCESPSCSTSFGGTCGKTIANCYQYCSGDHCDVDCKS